MLGSSDAVSTGSRLFGPVWFGLDVAKFHLVPFGLVPWTRSSRTRQLSRLLTPLCPPPDGGAGSSQSLSGGRWFPG